MIKEILRGRFVTVLFILSFSLINSMTNSCPGDPNLGWRQNPFSPEPIQDIGETLSQKNRHFTAIVIMMTFLDSIPNSPS